MLTTNRTISGIPLLLVYRDSIEQSKERGTVLFLHGFSASKDVQKPDLDMLAEEGFLLIGIDSWGHGDRQHPDFNNYFAYDSGYFDQRFIEVVKKTAIEIPSLIDELDEQNLIIPSKLGLVGISMGAFISYKVIVEETRIKCAALFIGSPNWGDSPESPHLFSEDIHPTALLTLVAGKDATVPPASAKALHHQLVPHYADSPNKLKLVEYPESDHMMEEEDWLDAMDNAKQWLNQFI
ncbi:alpha/beta hydrolase [Agarivorans sp. TSD2052]|uniref:alpha/beta hydrolase n=1 Tax=Agarivorans sp. TSD2052 TaxID=2937286 RepID=UPI00200D2FCB|nr:alpha/beta fold hydrolase [Agarivorans sp. TSD2052]UPW17541.1 alpha/beta hydrolase [Agarivorans sp. TSD2052]